MLAGQTASPSAIKPSESSVVCTDDQLVEDGRESVQLLQVRSGQGLQDPVAPCGDADAHDATVLRVGCSFHQARSFCAVDQLDRAVRPQQHVLGQIADSWRLLSGMALDRHQQLMLDVREARLPRLVLAPALKLSQRNAELEQLLEIALRQPSHFISVASLQLVPRTEHVCEP